MGTTAIVAGGTGLVGRELIQLLLNDHFYDKVVALVRKRMHLEHDKLYQVVTDYSNLTEVLDGSDWKQAHVFCTLGTTIKKAKTKEQFRRVDFEYPKILGQLARKFEADVFAIVTAMGASRSSAFFYNQVKGEVEDELIALGLPYLFLLRPSLILGDREDVRLGERVGAWVSKAIAPLMLGGMRAYRPIHAKTIALGLINSAKSGIAGVEVLSSDEIVKRSNA
ncbi:NAD(P)H-binding protein [Paenibacillus sp. SYP-B3998]|uniref:NAD(P)H-binding protein n=1 Tax=Paenibacillus sp. SYP-B3998 TaxID=2678564 RepID=A0A6G4A418_9BACL|nr:NAD(P)H-binding protein [Paenibacillus sp. SYP-B3998]